MIHLFSAHMPPLTRIARSTVLSMQICFAWKSIWSCSKESRTALLLSPLAGSRSLLPSLSSRVEDILNQLHTHAQAVLRQLPPPRGQYADLTGAHWRPDRERDKEPCNCLPSWITHAVEWHTGNHYPLCEDASPLILSFCSTLSPPVTGAVPCV